MTETGFAGDKKVGQSFLSVPEKALVAWGTPKIPLGLETNHLTLLTVLWSILSIIFGLLAQYSLKWLWMISVMIVLQYITDLFDGAVGRARDTGLVKWGFYMDHFLDYIFLSSLVLAGYFIAPSNLGFYFIILLILTGGFMVNSFLGFAATNQFEIYFYGIGPTEMRIVFILLNTTIILTGTSHFWYSVPLLCLACLIGLIFMVRRTSARLWALDMKNKENQ
ncbi:CDP-alcohol phosphatidyltransferase family protein [bacterium]|nr:CDP-alcohol phosphatidyltransferase family protein [bacterium]